jgi:hypothetical protein
VSIPRQAGGCPCSQSQNSSCTRWEIHTLITPDVIAVSSIELSAAGPDRVHVRLKGSSSDG